MVDNVDNHSIEFSGSDNNRKNSRYKNQETEFYDWKSQNTLLNVYGNYHKFINNMFTACSNICIKDFNHLNVNMNEEICINNCQKKFFTTYAIGENYLKTVANKSKNTDIFSELTRIDLIDPNVNNLN